VGENDKVRGRGDSVYEHWDFEELETVFGARPSPENVKETVSLLIRGRGRRHGSPPAQIGCYEAALNRSEEYARRAARLPDRDRVLFYKTLSLLACGREVEDLAAGGRARLGVYEALLARSWVVRFDDPPEMCRLAHAAVELAARFSPRPHGARRVADLRAAPGAISPTPAAWPTGWARRRRRSGRLSPFSREARAIRS
jgi:hypothetical protein